eukprot:432280-Pleurochrysis_carterae.AAC.2
MRRQRIVFARYAEQWHRWRTSRCDSQSTLQPPLKVERGPIRSSNRTSQDHARLSWRGDHPGRAGSLLTIHNTAKGGRGAPARASNLSGPRTPKPACTG